MGEFEEVRVDPETWDAAIAAIEGPQIVVGGPGTGKSEFLVRRARHLLTGGAAEPDELLILTFSRRGAAALRSRIESALMQTSPTVATTTFHGLSWRILEAHGAEILGWDRLPTLMTGPEQVGLVRELLAAERPEDWSPLHRSVLHTATFAAEVADFLMRAAELMISPDDLAGFDRPGWTGLDRFARRYQDELTARSRIDYASLVTAARRVVDEGVVDQYRYVLVDEYQDTTVAQAALLSRLAGPDENVTAAGDPYQSIFSFRGAHLTNIHEFPEVFRGPARRIVLTTSFRVPSAVLDAAVALTTGQRLPGTAGPVVPAPGTGRVDIRTFDQETAEAEWIADEVLRMQLVEEIPLSSMGVFVRSKRRFLAELSRALERRRIEHDTPDSRLADHPAVRVIFDVVEAACGTPDERRRATRRLLLGPLFRMSVGAVRALERDLSRTGTGWAQVLGTEPPTAPLAGLLADPAWATEQPAARGFWHLWTTLPQFAELVADPSRAEERAAWASLAQVISRYGERNPRASLADYVALAETEEFEAQPLLEYRHRGERLTVTTLHQSKGLDLDVVFIADAVDGVLPDLRLRDSLLESRHLAPWQGTTTAAQRRFRLQEETRLVYTAMTRAARRVVFTATTTTAALGTIGPSPFLDLLPATARLDADDEEFRPLSPADAEARLRRIAADVDETETMRRAAIRILAEAPGGMRSPDIIAATRRRGPDDGIVPDGHTLSASQASSYERCPRRYVLEHHLRVGDDETLHMRVGTLVHDVLEIAETAAIERGDAHSSAAEALAVLDDRFDPADFGGEPFAAAWRRRAATAIEHLYEKWPAPGWRGVACETSFAVDIGSATWRGRIDRIERKGRSLRVVDYKTSKSVPRVEEVADSLQLGLYAMAVDELGLAEGEVTAAELWFPLPEPNKNSIKTRSLDLDTLPSIAERLEQVATGIRSELWPATPNDGCDRCLVISVCPAWPDGREAFA